MPTLTDDVDLTLAYQNQLNAIADLTAAVTRQLWMELPGTVEALIRRWIDEARPFVEGGRAEAVDLTTAYLTELTGETPKTFDFSLLSEPRWTDPFHHTWKGLGEGKPWTQARQTAGSTAEGLAVDAVQSGGIERMTHSGLQIVGYRRVVSAGACDWCRLVSTQRYHTAQTASFGHGRGKHHNCHCTVVAIFGKRDPGRVINRTRLAEIKASR